MKRGAVVRLPHFFVENHTYLVMRVQRSRVFGLRVVGIV